MKPCAMRTGLTLLLATVLTALALGQARGTDLLSVEITSPTNGTIIPVPGFILVTAEVSRTILESTAVRVTFFDGTNDFASLTNLMPTELSWSVVATWIAAPGTNYILTAVAEDNIGLSATSQVVRVSVNTPPTAAIVSPTNQQTFLLRTHVLITAQADDADGSVTNVQFFSGTNLLGAVASEPFEFLWTNLTSGAHALKARAIDDLGAPRDSTAVNITINAPPTVSIVSPANDTVFYQQGLVGITAQASDSDGSVTNLEFFADGILIGRATNTSYTLNWLGVGAGTYLLTARATDDRGESTTSAPPVRITVLNAAPQVSISDPADRTELLALSDLLIQVQATDPDGAITEVVVLTNSTSLGQATMNSSDTNTWTLSWSNLVIGTYTLTARATDHQGLASNSAAVEVSVLHALIASPTNNAFFLEGTDVPIVVALAPDISQAVVDLLRGSNWVELVTSPPVTHQWILQWTNATLGTSQLRVRAADQAGLATTSAPVSVTVLDRPVVTAPPLKVSYRSGLLEQVVQLSNPTPSVMPPVRVWITGIPSGMQVFNPIGFGNGVPFVQYTEPILAGETVEVLIEYYLPSRQPPAAGPTVEVAFATAVPPPEVTGEPQPVTRLMQLSDGAWLLEFNSLSNGFYYVQYKTNVAEASWTTVVPSIRGSGNTVQWVDTGPPRTVRAPAKDPERYYQVILVP